MVCTDTLRIKHLPKELSEAQKEDFMRHFGALRVKVITSQAKAKSIVYAKFENSDVAKNVMLRIHQLNILNCRLSVEYAEQDILQGVLEAKKITDTKDIPDQKFFRNFVNNVNAFNDSVGFHQPPPSHLKYNYPKANRSTINNIAHALATIPRFYIQVLHLMNKMNLPPPFAMPEPPVRIIQPQQNPTVVQKPPENIPEKRKESSSESEIESDGESNKNKEIIPQKRPLPQKKAVKRPKFIKQPVVQPNITSKPMEKPEDIFEKVEVQQPRKIELRVMPELPPEPQKPESVQKSLPSQNSVESKTVTVEPPKVLEIEKTSILRHEPLEKSKQQKKAHLKKSVAPEIQRLLDSFPKEDEPMDVSQPKVAEPPKIQNTELLTPALSTVEKLKDIVPTVALSSSQESLLVRKSDPKIEERTQPAVGLLEPSSILQKVELPELPQKEVKEQKPPQKEFKVQEMPQEHKEEIPKDILHPIHQPNPVKTEPLIEPTSPEDEYPCISLEELRANQITDLSLVPAFKNYNPGEPTNKLYIKNCRKTVAVQDLEYIYNRYREEGTEDKPSEFNIRLMQEGRMKGQAFVTLDSVEMAQKAVTETNGFILKDRPLIVVFGKGGKKK